MQEHREASREGRPPPPPGVLVVQFSVSNRVTAQGCGGYDAERGAVMSSRPENLSPRLCLRVARALGGLWWGVGSAAPRRRLGGRGWGQRSAERRWVLFRGSSIEASWPRDGDRVFQ